MRGWDFEELYLAHFNMVYNYALALTRNAGEAEELTQEAFARFLRSPENWRGQGSETTWLCSTVKHLWVENLEAELDPGENTVVSSDVSTSLDGWYLDEIQESRQGKLISFPALKVKKFPQVETWYYAATKDSEQEHNVTATATGTWRYDLFLGWSMVASGEDSVSCGFITNFKREN